MEICLKAKRIIVVYVLAFVFLFVLFKYGFSNYYHMNNILEGNYRGGTFEWVGRDISFEEDDVVWIGHAFGVVGEVDYTNSLEAFNYNYALGRRVFEVDFRLTTDGFVVANHDKVNSNLSNFLKKQTSGGLTSLSFADVVRIMEDYPDVIIITDTKETNRNIILKQFQEMMNVILALNAQSVLDRIIVQVYYPEMLEITKEIHQFSRIILTLYKKWDGKDLDYLKKCVIGLVDLRM